MMAAYGSDELLGREHVPRAQPVQDIVWWSDVMHSYTLSFHTRRLELKFQREIWCVSKIPGRVCLLEAFVGCLFALKAVSQTSASLLNLPLPYVLALATTLARIIPAAILFLASPAYRNTAAVHYRLWRCLQPLIVLYMGLMCGADVDCQIGKGFLLEIFVLVPLVTPFIAPLPMKLHMSLQQLGALVSLLFVAAGQDWGLCTLLVAQTPAMQQGLWGNGTTAVGVAAFTTPQQGVFVHALNVPGACLETLVHRVLPAALVSQAGSMSCKTPVELGLKDASCGSLLTGMQSASKLLCGFMHMFLPPTPPPLPPTSPHSKDPLGRSIGLPSPSSQPSSSALHAHTGVNTVAATIGDQGAAAATELWQSCVLFSVVWIVSTSVLVSCLLFNWELRVRLGWWQQQHGPTVRLLPEYQYYSKLLWIQQALLLVLTVAALCACLQHAA